jgi:ASC-1-like (ASCH) protein
MIQKNMDYYDKYLKYKTKYLKLNDMYGGWKKVKNKHKRTLNKNNIASNMEANYNESLKEPWFTLIKLGLKKVEGRKNKGVFKEMKIGDVVRWFNDDYGPRDIYTKITKKVEYSTFAEYLETEGLDNCLPSFSTIESGVNVYRKWYSEEDERKYGVIAIHMELL